MTGSDPTGQDDAGSGVTGQDITGQEGAGRDATCRGEVVGAGIWLTPVGVTGSASGPDSPASCYLLQAPHEDGVFSLLLDLGPGAFGALSGLVEPAAVGAIGFSHLHADHCGDFGSFHVAARYSPAAPFSPRLLGPGGTSERLARMYEVDSDDEPAFAARWPAETWRPVQQVGPFTVRTTRVVHPVEAYAVRVERGGVSLVYSGDTGPSEALVELARGTDLLLSECGHPESAEPGEVHLRPSEAGELARRAEVGALLLTHVPAWVDAETSRAGAEAALGAPVALAAAGRTYRVR